MAPAGAFESSDPRELLRAPRASGVPASKLPESLEGPRGEGSFVVLEPNGRGEEALRARRPSSLPSFPARAPRSSHVPLPSRRTPLRGPGPRSSAATHGELPSSRLSPLSLGTSEPGWGFVHHSSPRCNQPEPMHNHLHHHSERRAAKFKTFAIKPRHQRYQGGGPSPTRRPLRLHKTVPMGYCTHTHR